jgi:anti-sigma factor RsiW
VASLNLSDHPKLEPRLARELEAAERAGFGGKPISILIELVDAVRAPKTANRRQAMKTMEQQSSRLQKALVARLVGLGAQNIQQAAIVNAVSADLAPAQIQLIAARPDVRIVRLARLEDATTANRST